MVKLVCGLHHVSSDGDQGKFLNDGASAWASPRRSKVVKLEVGLHQGCFIIGVMHGGGGISLSAVRPCGMDVTSRKALDMYGSPHITISYLLRGEQRDLEDKSQGWIGDTKG